MMTPEQRKRKNCRARFRYRLNKEAEAQNRLHDAIFANQCGDYDGFVSVKSLADANRLGIKTDPDDSEYPPKNYRGEWLHVNDHGNCTLYYRNSKGQNKEIASCV